MNGKKAKDVMLSLLVLMAAVSATWAGLRGADNAVGAFADSGENISIESQTAQIPEDATVIVVDAGHGGFDGGAAGSTTGVEESTLNLAVARMLADELLKKGYYVIMTRDDENALADTKADDMRKRKTIMQLDCADLVVSIHMNKFGDSTISGPMVFYMKNSEEGKALAESVMYSVCEAVGLPQRFANPEDLFVLRVPYAPSVLVECGFLSNPNDEKLLCDSEYQAKLAKGVCQGIVNYLASRNADSLSQGGISPLG